MRYKIHTVAKTRNNISEECPGLFYAKILLFGEYTIIFDSMALSIPFRHYSARFSFINPRDMTTTQFALRSNRALGEYCSWLKVDNRDGKFKGFFDTDAFEKDIEEGIFLDSDIPQGYGLGSSGALCAAVYYRYAVNRIGNEPDPESDHMRELKNIFAGMEAWFHGTSSGMDPLNCYLRRPLLMAPEEKIKMAVIPETTDGADTSFFLLDTGKPGKTEPLVNLFLERSREKSFMEIVNRLMIPAVNSCIGSILKPDLKLFLSALETLSLFQYANMKEMIPADFHSIWEEGLVSGDYFLKLCGSGGGGFLLGFTDEMEKTAAILEKRNLKALPVKM